MTGVCLPQGEDSVGWMHDVTRRGGEDETTVATVLSSTMYVYYILPNLKTMLVHVPSTWAPGSSYVYSAVLQCS